MSSAHSHLSLQPVAIALTNSAWNAYKSGQLQTARSLCQQSLAITKHNPYALHLLGLLHAEAEEFKVAERHLLKSLELSPSPNVWNDLAIMYRSQGRLEKTEMAIRKAISLSPDNSRAYYHAHLASIQAQAGNLKDAIGSYRQALELRPDWPEVYNNIGELLLVMNDLASAEEAFRHAICLNGNLDHPHQNLGVTLFNRGLHDEALACFTNAIQICPSSLGFRSNKIMMMTYLPGVTEKQLHEEALAYASYAEKAATRYTQWPDTLCDDRPLHVGFVSGRFCHSPVMHFLEGLLRELKQSPNIRISLYSNTPTHDGATEILKTLCSTWRTIANLSDKDAAATIYNDKVDVLIDLAGHSKHNRLPVFCWKPAPIQAAWMEFGATTGLLEMDYIICDKWSVTPEGSQYYVEHLWPLPHGRLCFTKPSFDISPNELPAQKNGYITFGSFNNFAKLNRSVFETWAEILKRVPGSRLVMSTSQLNNETIAASIRNTFESLGVEKGRLDILPPRPRNEFMRQYNLVDISLDSFPYQGVTTTVESLWM
jgi:predicted O-linked N-acetylglucosamine transferase (SPINDLY family)